MLFENVNKILMIQKITIEGYKSIKEQTVELFPINILIGGNGIGKSNFISAFTLIHNLYERNLQNKYASWEQELTQREQTVREKERELHIENTGNTDLEKRVNYEIMLKMNEVQEEAEERAAQYKNAVIETGGTEEDYQPITIQIDYKVGYSSDKVVSFVILKSETLASAYTERFFYNIDIESGKELNLRDVLGNDYKQIVDETIYKEIEERSKNPNNSYFTKDEGGFSGIENEYQNFYINSEGKVVIVFEKYEIAPGYMGTQEFVIDKQIF